MKILKRATLLSLILTGSLVKAQIPCATISAQPGNRTEYAGNFSSFNVSIEPYANNTFQWQVSSDNGTTWTNVSEAGAYTGSTTSYLKIASADVAMNNNQYRCVAINTCGITLTSTSGKLAVNVRPE